MFFFRCTRTAPREGAYLLTFCLCLGSTSLKRVGKWEDEPDLATWHDDMGLLGLLFFLFMDETCLCVLWARWRKNAEELGEGI